MALEVTSNRDYIKTGDRGGNFIAQWGTRLSNWASFIPGIGSGISWFFGSIGTAADVIGNLLKLRPLSAATALAAGVVSTGTNMATSAASVNPIYWAANIGQGLVTGRSMGSHARMVTENVIGGVTGVFGMKPTVLRSYQAGIGSIGGGAAQAGPGRFASQIAGERGRDANEMYAAYQRGDGGAHINELQSAYQGR